MGEKWPTPDRKINSQVTQRGANTSEFSVSATPISAVLAVPYEGQLLALMRRWFEGAATLTSPDVPMETGISAGDPEQTFLTPS